MRLQRAGEVQCPAGIIALAINKSVSHCGIVYTATSGAVRLCHLPIEGAILVETLPKDYYWVAARLDAVEALQIMVFIEFLLERNNKSVPYSFIYPTDGFDAVGRIRDGVGFTCSTF